MIQIIRSVPIQLNVSQRGHCIRLNDLYLQWHTSHFLDQNGNDQYTTKYVFQLDWLDQWMMQIISCTLFCYNATHLWPVSVHLGF